MIKEGSVNRVNLDSDAKIRRVACLIINWNGSNDTIELVRSLLRCRSAVLSIDLFIIDNASEKEDVQRLRIGLSGVAANRSINLTVNERNVGVPCAYNQAIELAGLDYDYYLRLDNDVVITENSLQEMINGLERHRCEGARIVGGNIHYYDRPEEDNCGAAVFRLGMGRTSIVYPDKETFCDGVLGCAMLVDREVVAAMAPQVFLGWLFLTTDESELSLRCAERGWRTLYLPRVIALHKGARSTSKVRSKATLFSCRNWAYLAIRYSKPKWVKPLVVGRLIITFLYLLSRGETARAKSLMVGCLAAIKGIDA